MVSENLSSPEEKRRKSIRTFGSTELSAKAGRFGRGKDSVNAETEYFDRGYSDMKGGPNQY